MHDEIEFREKAADVAKCFGTTESAVYRYAREGRLPAGTFVYLNERTVRFNLPALKRAAAEGAFAKPRERNSAAAGESAVA